MTHPDPSLLQMLLGLLAFLLPMLLYVVWSALSFWDLGRRDDVGTTTVWSWAIAIFALPFLGALAYLLAGSRVPSAIRLASVGGGVAVYGLVLAIGAAAGGIA